MKKFTLFLVLIGMLSIQSCTVHDTTPINTTDNDTISEVWEYSTNVNFTAGNNYSLLLTFHHSIYTSDMVLLYRLSGIDNGADVWKLLPETYYYSDGTLNFGYNFDFTQNNAFVSMSGSNLSTVSTQNRLNQVIRIVVIPGYFSNKSSSNINLSDYDTVAKVFNIDESRVIKEK